MQITALECAPPLVSSHLEHSSEFAEDYCYYTAIDVVNCKRFLLIIDSEHGCCKQRYRLTARSCDLVS
jgi:hypothetical protein